MKYSQDSYNRQRTNISDSDNATYDSYVSYTSHRCAYGVHFISDRVNCVKIYAVLQQPQTKKSL